MLLIFVINDHLNQGLSSLRKIRVRACHEGINVRSRVEPAHSHIPIGFYYQLCNAAMGGVEIFINIFISF